MDDEMRAAFARMERWFELGQQQHLEFRAEMERRFSGVDDRFTGVEDRFTGLEGRFTGLEGRFTGLEDRLTRLEHEVRALRDWVTGAIADLRSAVQQILTRLDRLERREGDPFG
jgi:predicted  nucleic acid-binding Zn-ribbon protein